MRFWQAVVIKEQVWGQPALDIERRLRRGLGPDARVWIPAVTEQGDHDPSSVWSAYVFLPSPVPPAVHRLWLVEQVLAEPIPETELKATVGRTVPVVTGDRVRVISGPHRGLSGTATKIRRDACALRIDLESGPREVQVDRRDVEVV